MSRRTLLFILVAFALASSCVVTNPRENYGPQNQTLELTLRFEQTNYHIGEPVVAIVTLKNIGTETIIINSRMAIDLPYRPSPMREIAFNVITPSGEDYWPSVKINNRFFQSGDFIALTSSDYVEVIYNLSNDSYEFIETGIYRVTANYQNTVDPSIVDPEDNRIAWKGELNSNEVFLTILP